jgi:hypothetical protein
MVFNTQKYWVCEFCPPFGILNNWKITFRKLDLFRPQGRGEIPTMSGPLKRANKSSSD